MPSGWDAWIRRTVLATAAVCLAAGPAAADAVADFYRGKQITLFVGGGTGGGYDVYARTVMRTMAGHIPGKPIFVARQMGSAGGLPMVNHVANAAEKDGTVIGASQNGVPFEPLFHILSAGGDKAQFDPLKLNWLGSPAQDVFVLINWHTSPIERYEDLLSREMIVGSSGRSTDNSVLARVLNEVLGTKLKIVEGYSGSSEIMLAMERGEVEGAAGRAYSTIMASQIDLVRDKKIRFLLQMGIRPHPDLKVPSAIELVKNDADRSALRAIYAKYQMARPLFMAAEVPAERVTAMRRAFDATMKDPAFLADAEKQRIEIQPVTGEEITELLNLVYATPKAVIEHARRIVQ